ncbi:MAG: hypothetical protein GY861_20155 [bacterium]|nr:hypothetical protein [bacterium]
MKILLTIGIFLCVAFAQDCLNPLLNGDLNPVLSGVASSKLESPAAPAGNTVCTTLAGNNCCSKDGLSKMVDMMAEKIDFFESKRTEKDELWTAAVKDMTADVISKNAKMSIAF